MKAALTLVLATLSALVLGGVALFCIAAMMALDGSHLMGWESQGLAMDFTRGKHGAVFSIAAGLFAFLLLGIAVFTLIAFRMAGSKPSASAKSNDPEETRIVQEIHQGLARMEDRVESLETILLERGRVRSEEETVF